MADDNHKMGDVTVEILKAIRSDIQELRQEVKQEIKEVKQEVEGVKQEVGELRQEVKQVNHKVEELKQATKKGFAGIRARIKAVINMFGKHYIDHELRLQLIEEKINDPTFKLEDF